MPRKLGMLSHHFPRRSYIDLRSRFNSALNFNRRQNLNGVYDIHTNVMQYPKIMQPTHGRWEQMPPSPPSLGALGINANQADGTPPGGTSSQLHGTGPVEMPGSDSVFPDIAPVYIRNYMIADTYYVSPPVSGLGIPGPDEEVLDIGPPGLSNVPDDVAAELPKECRRAFEEIQMEELKWKHGWGGEVKDRARAKLRISYNS